MHFCIRAHPLNQTNESSYNTLSHTQYDTYCKQMGIVICSLYKSDQAVPVHQWHLTRLKDRPGADNVLDSVKPPKRLRRITRTKQDRWARKREKAKRGQEIPRNRGCEMSEQARMDHRRGVGDRWAVQVERCAQRERERERERRGELPGAVLSYSLRSSRATRRGETDSTVVSLSRKILSCSSPLP